jgi:hypothetical protein
MNRINELVIALVLLRALQGASLPIQVISVSPPLAAKGTPQQPLYLYVRMANPDGTPKTGVAVPPASQGWKINVISAPVGFVASKQVPVIDQDRFGNKTQTPMDARYTLVLNAITEIDSGVYSVEVVPIVFAIKRPTSRGPTPFVPGTYVFRISMKDQQNNIADTLGSFSIQ